MDIYGPRTFQASSCFSSKLAEVSGSEGVITFFNSWAEEIPGKKHGKTIAKCWFHGILWDFCGILSDFMGFYGILWDVPSGNLTIGY